MKKSKFGKLALIAGSIYAVKALADKNKEETALNNIFAGLPQNAMPESAEIPFSPDQFKKWLDANPALKAALKGAAGEAGSNGSNGSNGVDGGTINNFRENPIVNLAFELGTKEGWTNNNFTLNQLIDGTVEATGTGYDISPQIKVDRNYLYKCSIEVKMAANNFSYNIRQLNFDGSTIGWLLLSTINTFVADGTFKKIVCYTSELSCEKISIAPECFGSIGTYKNLTFSKVSLGESVPSNLPYLPTGQEVYDTTTGDRGRYNGTAVDWYTMV